MPPENNQQPLVSWYFEGVQNGNIDQKWVTRSVLKILQGNKFKIKISS